MQAAGLDSGLVPGYHQADIISFQPTFSVPDPALDPDPALFFRGFQDVDKNKFFVLLLSVGTFSSVFEDNKLKRSHETVGRN